MCAGIDVDPVAHATAAAALAPLLAQPGAPTLHQLSGNYRWVVVGRMQRQQQWALPAAALPAASLAAWLSGYSAVKRVLVVCTVVAVPCHAQPHSALGAKLTLAACCCVPTTNLHSPCICSEVASLLATCPGGSLVGRVDAMLMDLGVSSMQVGGWVGWVWEGGGGDGEQLLE